MGQMSRPNMNAYFRAKIDQHVNGLLAPGSPSVPSDVARVSGGVKDSVITVTMVDGTEWRWAGGRYSARKVNLTYAPLMPRPID